MKNINNPIIRFLKAALLLVSVIFCGTIGYYFIEGWPLFDAFFMTIITISTVGYREIRPLTDIGRIFTLFVIFFGVGTLFYTLAVGVESMIEGHITNLFGKRRIMKELSKIKNHYILCGYGRVGQEIAKELHKSKVPFVLVEKNTEPASIAIDNGITTIRGSATEDDILIEAGIKKAKGLLTALPKDADNVFVALSAKTLNPDIFIVARAEEAETGKKLLHAGADRVVSPYRIGGRRMANLLVKPLICDYLDTVTHGHRLEYELEEVYLDKDSILIGKTIGESKIRDMTGALILAIQRDGEFNSNPSAATSLRTGDYLLAIGTSEQLESFMKYGKIKRKKH